jgi:hypothetical protein
MLKFTRTASRQNLIYMWCVAWWAKERSRITGTECTSLCCTPCAATRLLVWIFIIFHPAILDILLCTMERSHYQFIIVDCCLPWTPSRLVVTIINSIIFVVYVLGWFPVVLCELKSKYITGTDRRCTVLSRDADFLRDKTSLTSEVPCFCSNFCTVSSSNNY